MNLIILFAAVILIILIIFIILFVCIKESNDKKKVIKTSITIKKIKELNDKFPKINIDYNHNFSDCINFKTRASVTKFNPDKYFLNFKPELSRIAKIRLKNVYYYEKYKDLFNQTINQSITPDSIISQTKIKSNKYRKIEKEYISTLFDRKLDSREITYKINALYISPKGRNTYSSPNYIYREKDFIKEKPMFEFDLDYNPNCEEKVISNTPKIDENIETAKSIEDEILMTNEPVEIIDGGIIYNIIDDNAVAVKIEENNSNLILNHEVLYKNMKYKTQYNQLNFSGNKTIESITINEGIECIDDSMFKNCTALKSITLPSSLKIIRKKAFSGCLKLKEIKIPIKVENIEEEAFSLCGSLTDIYLNESIKNIGPSILWYSNKAKIHIPSGCDISHFDPEWNVDNNEVIFE